jgi:hypothetical protein
VHSVQISNLKVFSIVLVVQPLYLQEDEWYCSKVYEKRAQLETRSPLILVTTLEVDDIPTVELAMTYDDGSKTKVKVPTHDLESVEQVFKCFHEF